MGSIVKSIGRVFKGIGKTLKKIAPVLLVAAAVYVGYGFATGFTGVGWPTITGWGKSLMSGVSSGSTVSQAAAQATQTSSGVASQVTALGAEAPVVPVTAAEAAAPSALETAAGAGAQQPGVTGGMLSSFGGGGADSGSMAFNAFFPEAYAGDASVLSDTSGKLYLPGTDAEIIAFDKAMGSGMGAGTTGGGGLGADAIKPSYTSLLAGGGPDAGSMAANAFTPQKAIANFGALGKDAWNRYKQLWKENPLIALMTTNQVVSLIADAMEKEKTAKEYGGMSNEEFRQVLAANPRTTPTVAQIQQKYGRGVPTGQMSARPNSGQVQQQVSRQYSEPLTRRSQGLIGPKTQGQLA